MRLDLCHQIEQISHARGVLRGLIPPQAPQLVALALKGYPLSFSLLHLLTTVRAIRVTVSTAVALLPTRKNALQLNVNVTLVSWGGSATIPPTSSLLLSP